jgi:hypothetical protein
VKTEDTLIAAMVMMGLFLDPPLIFLLANLTEVLGSPADTHEQKAPRLVLEQKKAVKNFAVKITAHCP